MNYTKIIKFWFEELSPKDWWVKNPDLDQKINDRFSTYLTAAKNNELIEWRATATGALAEIIVLDQFSRNIFRNKPEAFAQDNQALELTIKAIQNKFHKDLDTTKLPFLLMPIMHSESKETHNEYLKYFKVPGLENTYEFELKHKVIIDEFGRYPHRNMVLNRDSTPKELEFLSQPGSSF